MSPIALVSSHARAHANSIERHCIHCHGTPNTPAPSGAPSTTASRRARFLNAVGVRCFRNMFWSCDPVGCHDRRAEDWHRAEPWRCHASVLPAAIHPGGSCED